MSDLSPEKQDQVTPDDKILDPSTGNDAKNTSIHEEISDDRSTIEESASDEKILDATTDDDVKNTPIHEEMSDDRSTIEESAPDKSTADDMKCEVTMIHRDAVLSAQEALPDEELLFELAEFFKVFGDTTRVRILYALHHTELCVCDLSALLSISQSAISHQLRLLKAARLVRNRRDGKVVYYSLDDDHVKEILDVGVEHLQHQ